MTVGGAHRPAVAVVVAAGPWTPRLVDPTGAWRPIMPLWGVVAEVRLRRTAAARARGGGHPQVSSSSRVEAIRRRSSASSPPARSRRWAPRSCREQPDAAALAPLLRERGARFVPALAETPTGAVRACARPLSADGRPLLGRAPGRDDVFVAAGHGPWGISLGPASARLVADLVLGRGTGPPAVFDPGRFPRERAPSVIARTHGRMTYSPPQARRARIGSMTLRIRRVAVLASLASLAAVPALADDPIPDSRYAGTDRAGPRLAPVRVPRQRGRLARRAPVHPVPHA